MNNDFESSSVMIYESSMIELICPDDFSSFQDSVLKVISDCVYSAHDDLS